MATTGGIFHFRCASECGQLSFDQFCWTVDFSRVVCPSCGCETTRVEGPKKQQGLDYDHEILSDAMGCAPNQVAEHRRIYPNIEIRDDGRIPVRNHHEGQRIRKTLGMFDKNGYAR